MIELALLVLFVIEGLIICVESVWKKLEVVERAYMALQRFLREASEGESEK